MSDFQYEYDFMEAKIIQQTSAEDAYRKFEEMGLKQVESLRKLTKDVNKSFCLKQRQFFK